MFSAVPKFALYNVYAIRKISNATGEFICPNLIKGMDYIKDARLHKGLAFSLEERQALGLHGILACSVKTQEEQLAIANYSIDRYKNNMNKYLYLTELHDTNERLYFSLLNTDVEKFLPLVYTPTVGLACQRFGLAYRRPRGLFITINDKNNIMSVLNNWPEQDVRAICFTDGERILGLGDLGAYGMGIPIGKLALYTALSGVKPHQCLPITLDVGTNNQSLIEDPLYIGLRHKRVTGKEYEEFIDEFMHACVKKWGTSVILQFEDFALPNATPLLAKYKDTFCTFNDDIQGTASVAVAGLFAAMRITKLKMSENIILFLGAGSASTGIGHLTVDAMKEEGLSEKEAYGRIYMHDIDGIVTSKRPSGVPDAAAKFAKDMEPEKNFEKVVAKIKPNVLIGCSTVSGAFTPAILKIMSQNHKRPVIFALSNPTSQAECTPQQAYDSTEGRCVYASGSPFPPVKYNGKTYITGQGNNSYIFPGVALGVISASSTLIPDSYFLTAAKTLAHTVQESDLSAGRIYPPLSDLRPVSLKIALAILQEAYKQDLATVYPKPKDFLEHINSYIYDLKYPSALPSFYKYPDPPPVKMRTIEEAYRAKGEYEHARVSGSARQVQTLF